MASDTLITGVVNNTPILQKIMLSAAGDDRKLNTKEEVSLFLKTCNEQKAELEKENIVVTDLGNSKFTIEKTTKDTGKSTVNFDLNEDSLVEIVEAGLMKGVGTYNNNQLNTKIYWGGVCIGDCTKNIDTREVKINNTGGIKAIPAGLLSLICDFFTNDYDDAIKCEI